MADDLTFNKVAAAVLATGLLVFGLQNVTRIVFEQTPPKTAGDKIAIQETASEGGPVADVIPDWGTVLPKADITAGQAVTAKCQSCHNFDAAGTNAIGPGLYGVVGRPPGTHPGYTYDSAMQDFAKTHTAWTYDLLYQFLKSPGSFMPGTKMTFVGLPSPQDRINVIAYLRSNGSPTYPIPAPKPATAAASPAAKAQTPAAPGSPALGAAPSPAPGAAPNAHTPTLAPAGAPAAGPGANPRTPSPSEETAHTATPG